MPIVAVGLIGAGMWGYQENREKNSVLIKAENQYQRAFHDLNAHMDKLQQELGKTVAVNSRMQVTPSLANVWRMAYSAQNDVGQLPLTLMPFNKTEEFLSNVAEFSYKTAIRDIDKKPLTQDEYKTLQVLFNQSKEIQRDLQKVQTSIISNQLRWMDVEKALAMDKKQEDNTIIDGLKMVDKNVEGYSTTEFGAGTGTAKQPKTVKSLTTVQGKDISVEEAKKIGTQFAGLPSGQIKNVKVTPNGKGDRFQSYSVMINRNNSNLPVEVDVSKKGGYVVWMLDDRTIGKPSGSITRAIAQKNAADFLKNRGYANMVPISLSKYDGVEIYSFVNQQGDVRIYPDVITVKVALDTGSIIGIQAEPYVLKHHTRNIPKAGMSAKDARKRVNPSLEITDTHFALVEDDEEKEVLTYEFIGRIDRGMYRIYLDATNGQEVKVEKIEAASI